MKDHLCGNSAQLCGENIKHYLDAFKNENHPLTKNMYKTLIDIWFNAILNTLGVDIFDKVMKGEIDLKDV